VKASHEEVQLEHLAKSRTYRMLALRWKNTSEERINIDCMQPTK